MPFGKKQPAAASVSRKPAARPAPSANAAADLAPAVDAATIAEITAWPKDEAPKPRFSAEKANLMAALVVRAILIVIAGGYLIGGLLAHGEFNRLLGLLLFAMVADYGRVLAKALRMSAD